MDRPSLSLCVLTRNDAGRLGPLLAQAAQVADEVLVVDDGSTDGTADLVARTPKARFLPHPLNRDFAQQRNFAIENAKGDWVLFLDSDELLGPNLLRLIPAILRTSFRTVKTPTYWMTQADPPLYVDSHEHYPDRHIRLFRRLPGIRYNPERPIHETLPRSVREPCLWLRHSHILHFSFVWQDRAAREEKVRRYAGFAGELQFINRMYLYEDLPHQLRPCREGWRGTGTEPFVASGLDYWRDRVRLWLPRW
jgi:glycosyltransferase involved in cell wall biosynthesis